MGFVKLIFFFLRIYRSKVSSTSVLLMNAPYALINAWNNAFSPKIAHEAFSSSLCRSTCPAWKLWQWEWAQMNLLGSFSYWFPQMVHMCVVSLRQNFRMMSNMPCNSHLIFSSGVYATKIMKLEKMLQGINFQHLVWETFNWLFWVDLKTFHIQIMHIAIRIKKYSMKQYV